MVRNGASVRIVEPPDEYRSHLLARVCENGLVELAALSIRMPANRAVASIRKTVVAGDSTYLTPAIGRAFVV